MELLNLDKQKVRNVTNASATATRTMIMLGFRQRAHTFTNLSSIKDQLLRLNEKVIDKDYMDFWRGLEKAGVGSIILGRRGRQTRFEWNYSLKQIAKIAIEGKGSEINEIDQKRPKKVAKQEVVEGPKKKRGRPFKIKSVPQTNAEICVLPVLPQKQERLVYRIPVRPDYTLEINLPVDVSASELEKISEYFSPAQKLTA